MSNQSAASISSVARYSRWQVCAWLWLYCLSISSAQVLAASAAKPTAEAMVARYHMTLGFDAHNQFQIRLIHEALEATRADYGAYQIKPYGLAPTAKRQAILLNEGELLNMQWASPGTPISQAEVIQVPFNLLQGMLGYRVCLINAESNINFTAITNLRELLNLRVGQGFDWVDQEVYKQNHIPVYLSPGLESLFPSLALKRFDCLALGVNEAMFIYNEYKESYPFLQIEPSLLIYYEFPTYLYVSKRYPELAERMASGFNTLKVNGTYAALRESYFADLVNPLRLAQRKIICLKNPFIPGDSQCLHPPIMPEFNTH